MADLDAFLQEYATWANEKPDQCVAQLSLTITFPFLGHLALAQHLIPCCATWESRGRFHGIAEIYNEHEETIGHLTVHITPPATAHISNHPITIGSSIGFKFDLNRPKWHKSLTLKAKECQPPFIMGWVDIDDDRQPTILRIDHRAYSPAHK